jgi:hypothetical protein
MSLYFKAALQTILKSGYYISLTLFCKAGCMLRLIEPLHFINLAGIVERYTVGRASLRDFQKYKF